ncbi:unnamed protein product [Rotaria sp. Silwood2]|nr:unnamed protein product [Rotaria sp. Silwood2]CAF2875746.1 unnamed protein product [Rotaria sp. Silwood2]CAF3044567.1 unnamed protein product [Rotaria sp. Silwood2]CAF4198751.1 unnamed protein product [Rotaria sp. Silwood2]CAF4254539.1 unnamed protein product [Rotaria sp. Silwood2]
MSNTESWPNLVGKPVYQAVVTIKSQNSNFDVIPLPEGSPVTFDFRPNRVHVFFDANRKVSSVPSIG